MFAKGTRLWEGSPLIFTARFFDRMKFFKFSYIGAVLAGALLALSFRYYGLSEETARLRTEAYEFQRFAENQQIQIAGKRQQLQAQQEKLSKGNAIGETVGPAVLKDIVAFAEKPANTRLRELLQKHGVQVKVAAPETPAKKGGN